MWNYRKLRGGENNIYVWRYPQGFKEHPSRDSRAVYKDNGVFEFHFNSRTDVRINTSQTRRLIGRELKTLLGCNKYICVVEPAVGSTRKDDMVFNTQFYCKLEKLPTPEMMSEIPNLIKNNTIALDFSE